MLDKVIDNYNAEDFYDRIDLDKDFSDWIRLEAEFNFWAFCLYMDYEFFRARKQIMKPIADAMQEIEDGEISNLYVGMPPRAGKSYITTLFSTWSLGRTPSKTIMRNTVTNKLYKKFSKDAIDIIKGQTHHNRFKQVFPDVKLATENVQDGWSLTDTESGISYFGAGVGGTVIGFGASKCAILDDSIKGVQEAMSETMLDKKWNWYTGVHQSRMEKNCPEIHIATRWSKRDIPGKLIDKGQFSGEDGKKIVVPALIDGHTFCEDVHSTEYYLEKRQITDNLIWKAEYMQSPVEAKGLVFSEKELNRFSLDDLNDDPDGVIMAGDIADEGDDSLCCPLGYIYDDKVFVTDIIFTKDPIEVTQPLVAGMIDDEQPARARFESNNGGKGFAMKVRELISANTTVKWKRTVSNKHTRILMKSGFVKDKFYFREDYKAGSDYDKFMKEFTKYNRTGKVKHDDAPDGVTMLAELFDKLTKGSKVAKKPVGF